MSALQTAITNLQLKHSELVAAVKSYPGTVASAANAAVGEASVEQRKVRDTVRNLRKQIGDDGQSLILDWEHDTAVVNGEGKLLSEVVEFSRSTGGGRFGPDGQYEWVEAGVPRIDYDPATGECRGLLIEEQRTNSARNSTVFSWIQASGVNAVEYAHDPSIPAPDGTFTATRVTKTGSNARFATSSWRTGDTRSIYARTVEGEGSVYLFILNTNSQAKLFRVDTQWRRFSIPDCQISQLHLVDFRGGADLEEVLVWGFQSEVGSFPTSYIPTQGSAVTRAKDNLTLVAREGGGDAYAFETEYSLLGDLRTASTWLGLTTPTGTGSDVGINASGRVRSSRYDLAYPEFNQPPGDDIHLALSVSPTEIAGANAVGASFRVNGNYDTGQSNTLNINRSGNYMFNGHLKSWSLYPFALTPAQLEELTQ